MITIVIACNKSIEQPKALPITSMTKNGGKQHGNGNPACPTCNLNAQLSGPDIYHFKFSCPTPGNNCKLNSKSGKEAAFDTLDSYVENNATSVYFQHVDYTPIFGTIEPYYLDLLQNGTLKVCKISAFDGSVSYAVVDSACDCDSVTADEVYTLIELN
ncbi:MAG: hypothetical protein JST06_00810 [Bacteroidetes bacterium]|nr:hypothetical protein [Bacteroidota bacterium]MBS1630754.1 hypothetical protein [Bacteroidota bacterium]